MEQSDIYKGMLSEFFSHFQQRLQQQKGYFHLYDESKLTKFRESLQAKQSVLFYFHSSKTDILDLETVAKEFVSVNSHYFGKF
jgi:hypothetical protein